MTGHDQWPLPHGKDHDQESVFRPENLLREARRQKQLPDVPVPAVCLLDPDGDIVRHLAATGTGRRHPGWACYHTDMWVTAVPSPRPSSRQDAPPIEVGVVGNAVGAPFAVLVAEQLHASGADLVISITSAGQLVPLADPPYFVLIEAALRDEGTSTHYLPPARWATAPTTCCDRSRRPCPGCPSKSWPGGPGPPTPPTGKPPPRSRRPGPPARSVWRWRPQPCTPTPPPATVT